MNEDGKTSQGEGPSVIVRRRTAETDVSLRLTMGSAAVAVDTGVPMFDHLLETMARHGRFGLTVEVRGDLQTGPHHTMEDTGLVLGRAVLELQERLKSVNRFGWGCVPMDEALLLVAVDLSGRPGCWCSPLSSHSGPTDTPYGLLPHFLGSCAAEGRFTLHVHRLAGTDPHHVAEAAAKGLGLALNAALGPLDMGNGPSSSKGPVEWRVDTES